jgi:hypothetical protein
MSDLIRTVFKPTARDQRLLLLLDLPNSITSDNTAWQDRRILAAEWLDLLETVKSETRLVQHQLFYFENTGSDNADLPETCFEWHGEPQCAATDKLLEEGRSFRLWERLADADLVLAPTQFSATAPLKLLASQYGFRAASMPGFSRAMIPALGVDYELVHEQVVKVKARLDEASSLQLKFTCDGDTHELIVDLRNRKAHASSGLIRETGTAWNLPSGEAFIVPVEGEQDSPSETEGHLPVQFGDEVVLYRIVKNRATRVLSDGPKSKIERKKLAEEPAYGNIAEIGFGVLKAFGIQPVGEMLLDEKLGLHVAFGRSDHFGGAVSPAHFNDPKNVIHIDRIYIPEVQGRVHLDHVLLRYPDGTTQALMKDGAYLT